MPLDGTASAGHATAPSGQQDLLLKVDGIEVEFPTIEGVPKTALSDFSFEMCKGEILGLVGESGAGKTVLARTLLGVPPAPGRITTGSITFDGVDFLSRTDKERRQMRGSKLSMIVANPRSELDPLVPVGKQVATMLMVHRGMSAKAAEKAAFDMLVAVQIPDPATRMNAYPHELSGGMAQRVVIAIALICKPQFIVSDDATSGLDVTVQAQILEMLRTLTRDTGSALLFITRDMAIAAHYCDRVAVIYRGQIMEIAPRFAFFDQPRHPMTIMLMTAFSHNERLRRLWTVPIGNPEEPTGCAYAARCVFATDQCRASRPPLVEMAPGHSVRCYHPVAR